MDHQHSSELIRNISNIVIFGIALYAIYRRRKKIKGTFKQAVTALDGKLNEAALEVGQLVFSGPSGENCWTWTTEKTIVSPPRLFVRVNHPPSLKFTFKSRNWSWQMGLAYPTILGKVVAMGTDIDSLGKLITSNPSQAQVHFNDTERRQSLAFLEQAGFTRISADDKRLVAVKENFFEHDLDPGNIAGYAKALCALK